MLEVLASYPDVEVDRTAASLVRGRSSAQAHSWWVALARRETLKRYGDDFGDRIGRATFPTRSRESATRCPRSGARPAPSSEFPRSPPRPLRSDAAAGAAPRCYALGMKPYVRFDRADGAGGRKLRTASWDEALDRAAEGFRRSRDEHGPESFGMFSCSKATNEVNYLAEKFARWPSARTTSTAATEPDTLPASSVWRRCSEREAGRAPTARRRRRSSSCSGDRTRARRTRSSSITS
jgi:formate dehydrogenase major subunit